MWVTVRSHGSWGFLRINTDRPSSGGVLLTTSEHTFLSHDSYLNCHGDLISVDDNSLATALEKQGLEDRRGIIGCIAESVRDAICGNIESSRILTGTQKRQILSELRMRR